MEVLPTSSAFGRRLDRLRHSRTPALAAHGQTRVDHGADLAQALGGRAVPTASGSVVVIESTQRLPLGRRALAALPYDVGEGQPLVCLDLETTGLATAAGTLPFLIGVGIWRGDVLTVRQLLLADHAQERGALAMLEEALPADAWLVTYNGRCFDWPLLVARYRLHRRDPPPLAGHLDLLPVARQLWKHRTGDARLATIERALCGVGREEDLPGALIPERYFAYLRSRRGEMLRQIVEHNRQDIVSLGGLLAVLCSLAELPETWPQQHPGDLAGLARGYGRRRRPEDALRCVEAGLSAHAWASGVPNGAPLYRRLSAERARLLARLGRRAESHAAWHEIARRGGPGAAAAWLHVARYREHVERDLAGALDACREAGAVAERARAWGRPMVDIERDLARRVARLQRRSMRRAARFSRGVRRAA